MSLDCQHQFTTRSCLRINDNHNIKPLQTAAAHLSPLFASLSYDLLAHELPHSRLTQSQSLGSLHVGRDSFDATLLDDHFLHTTYCMSPEF